MINKPRILFIGDKWCAGNINYGLSGWEGNLWKSLQAVNLAEVEAFHFDEYYLTNKVKGDEALLEKIAEFKPQLICLVIYNLPGSNFNVPAFKTLETIKKYFSAPLFGIWGDLEQEEQVKISEAILPFIDFNIFTATSAVFRRLRDPKKYSYFWVPKNPEYFYDPGRARDIDLSYLGSSKPDRMQKIRCLEEHGIKVYHTGGEREKHLTTAEFTGIFQRSKIILSFSRAGYVPFINNAWAFIPVANARVFEIMNCGGMLLEEAGPETAKLFIPNVDYVPYFSKKDLLEKTRYYLQNETERAEIANRGYLKAQQYYSAHRFWKIVLDKMEKVISAGQDDKTFKRSGPYQLDQADDKLILANWGRKTIELPWPRLRSLSLSQAWKLKIIDWLCSSKLSYCFYTGYKRIADWRSLLFDCSYSIYKAARYILPKRFGGHLAKIKKSYLKLIMKIINRVADD